MLKIHHFVSQDQASVSASSNVALPLEIVEGALKHAEDPSAGATSGGETDSTIGQALPEEGGGSKEPPLNPGLWQSGDIKEYARFGITPELMERAKAGRVSDHEARTHFLIKHSGSNSGILFTYYDLNGKYLTARLRRDNTPDGAAQHPKYIMPKGSPTSLYLVSGCREYLNDLAVPVVLVEAEKSVLALTGWAELMEVKLWPIGLGGCWGWSSNGSPLPELAICCRGRTVTIMLDSNAATNPHVRTAQAKLARVLKGFGATEVLIATLPTLDGVNGPDDLIAKKEDGYGLIKEIMEKAIPAREFSITEAEAAIASLEEAGKAQQPHTVPDIDRALEAAADVSKQLQRELFEGRLAKALHGIISKQTVLTRIANLVKEYKEQQGKYAQQLQYVTTEPVDAATLVETLTTLCAERLYLPPGAALLLAYFALNSWTFDVFDTTPYLSLESAVPQCGKSTAIKLLTALSCRSQKATSLTEAVLFRIIDAETPTLLIDESEIMKGHSERAEALRPIANEGYKRGGRVPRCAGENNEVRWFNVYCPKVFAGIGGLDGALLDRCIVVHMEKAPKSHVRKSSRDRALRRDSQPLVKQLEAYAIQAKDALRQLYEAEPDCGYWPSISDREAELWGPLLIHAKCIGPQAEARLLAVANKFCEQKAEMQSTEWHIAQTIDLLEAIKNMSGDTFTPGDLVDALMESEAWAKTMADVKGHDEQSIKKGRAAKVGYFLRRFRLSKKKDTQGNKAYNRLATIKCLAGHVPDAEVKSETDVTDGSASSQGIDNTNIPDGTDGYESCAGGSQGEASETNVGSKLANVTYVAAHSLLNHPYHPSINSHSISATHKTNPSPKGFSNNGSTVDGALASVNHPADQSGSYGSIANPAGSQPDGASVQGWAHKL
jgi:hypothetical protein